MGEEGLFSTQLTYIKVGGLTQGAPYMFRLRAFNVHGWGPYSLISTIRAARQPDVPSSPTLTVNNILVQIRWQVPYENSAQVTGYRVYVGDADNVF